MSPAKRHSDFYFADGSAIFLVEDTLYKLHMSFLQPASVVLQNMFTMPSSATSNGTSGQDSIDGLSDEKPIRLAGPFTVKKFNDLLQWLYRRGLKKASLDELRSLLELGTFLEMDIARTFAIEGLSSPAMGLTPSLQLQLALNFQISEWVEPSFEELLAIPIARMSLEDYRLLGLPVIHLIVTTQAKIREHRLLVAYNPLKPTHDASCGFPTTGCQSSWESAWWDGMARHYLHPEFPASPQDIIMKLENTPIAGVTPACQNRAVQVIKQQHVFEREYEMKEEALKTLKNYQGTVFNW